MKVQDNKRTSQERDKLALQKSGKMPSQADGKLMLHNGDKISLQVNDKLTLQETEQLCELYMDCKLSVLEESELQYLLSKVDYHSYLIDEVRDVMGVELAIGDNASDKAASLANASVDTTSNTGTTVSADISNMGSINADSKKRRPWSKRIVYSGIAASIAILFGIGLSLYHNSSSLPTTAAPYYLAYADGHRLSDEAAKAQIEAEMQSAEDFMKEMSELEAQEKQMMDNFYNL